MAKKAARPRHPRSRSRPEIYYTIPSSSLGLYGPERHSIDDARAAADRLADHTGEVICVLQLDSTHSKITIVDGSGFMGRQTPKARR